ncbi:MAG: AAA family ATPase [Nanoarchaeota archaeon]|nr:AAA family ATPase [Nanoarchaeota archaeon]
MQKPKKLILCIIGLPGAGKTTVAGIIRKKFSACLFESGDVIREEVRRRGLRYTKENDRKIAEWFHAGRERLIISRLSDRMKTCGGKIIVAEGFFAPEEISMLGNIGKTVLIAVAAPSAVRYRREMLRRRFSGESEKYLRERDRRELSEGLGKLLKKSDYKLPNSTTRKELERRTVALAKKILEKESSAGTKIMK